MVLGFKVSGFGGGLFLGRAQGTAVQVAAPRDGRSRRVAGMIGVCFAMGSVS